MTLRNFRLAEADYEYLRDLGENPSDGLRRLIAEHRQQKPIRKMLEKMQAQLDRIENELREDK